LDGTKEEQKQRATSDLKKLQTALNNLDTHIHDANCGHLSGDGAKTKPSAILKTETLKIDNDKPAPKLDELDLGGGCGSCPTKNCGACGVAFNDKAVRGSVSAALGEDKPTQADRGKPAQTVPLRSLAA
jgi:hypothetical protein